MRRICFGLMMTTGNSVEEDPAVSITAEEPRYRRSQGFKTWKTALFYSSDTTALGAS